MKTKIAAFINKIVEFVKSTVLYRKIYWLYLFVVDYRWRVPANAGINFAYYLLMSIVPICSLFAFLASILNVDTGVLTNLLQKYLSYDYANIIVQVLRANNLSWTTIITIGVSIWVASRGFNQLYKISKEMFPLDRPHNFIVEQLLVMLKAILIFILLLCIVAMATVIPFLSYVLNLSSIWVQAILLYCVIFIVMFLIYKIIPDQNVHFVDTVKGTALASLLIEIIIGVLSFYFSRVDYHNVYGPLAALVMIMLALSIIAEAIYIGMYVMFEFHMKRINDALQAELKSRL